MRVELLDGQIVVEYDVNNPGSCHVGDNLHYPLPPFNYSASKTGFNAAIDGITSLIAALPSAGVDITTPLFNSAVQSAVDAVNEEFD